MLREKQIKLLLLSTALIGMFSCCNSDAMEKRNPLHAAVEDGNLKQVETLIANYDNADKRCVYVNVKEDGFAPLHLAARYGYTQIASKLIVAGAEVVARCFMSMTPLHYTDNQKTAELLLSKGANPFAFDMGNRTPLEYFVSIDPTSEYVVWLEKKLGNIKQKDRHELEEKAKVAYEEWERITNK